ncbi:hypothetical protein KAR91_14160 [Candidatus Pacearchaeota archaeon]|nr:hypothetical protein [Candidatus Pacearchaeota archaeon]
MDMLKKQLLDSIKGTRSGDLKIDEANENLSRYVIGTLSKFEEDMARTEAKKTHFTPAGLAAEKEKIRAKAKQEMVEVFEKSSWTRDIGEVGKRFEDLTGKDPIQILIEEGRQRETRQYLREFKDDIAVMAVFQQRVLDGDKTAIGAIENSPFQSVQVDPSVMKIGIEKMRLRSNPAAAERLDVLQKGQAVYESLKTFFHSELGGDGDDPIKALAE